MCYSGRDGFSFSSTYEGSSSVMVRSRRIATRPVRTISRMPNSRIRSIRPRSCFRGLRSRSSHELLPRPQCDRGRYPPALEFHCDDHFGADLDQHQIAFNVVFAGKVLDGYHGDDFFQLLSNLVQRLLGTIHHKRDAGKLGILGGPTARLSIL